MYISALLAQQLGKSVLLGVGDTISKLTSPYDRSTRCIFGDAASATLLSPSDNGEMIFQFSSYGDRSEIITMENSGFRIVDDPKNDGYFYMAGADVMKFTIVEVVEQIRTFLLNTGISKDNISLFAFHQANRLIVSSLANSLGIQRDKAPFTAKDIGNASSVSIPLLLSSLENADLSNVLCAGFGVGLSVGVCKTDFSATQFCGIAEL